MIITNRNSIEWTVLYTHKYAGAVGQDQYPFEADMKGYLIITWKIGVQNGMRVEPRNCPL